MAQPNHELSSYYFEDVADTTNLERKDEKVSKQKTYNLNEEVTIISELEDLSEHLFNITTDAGENPFDDDLLSFDNQILLIKKAINEFGDKLLELIAAKVVEIFKEDDELTYEIKQGPGFKQFKEDLIDVMKSKKFEPEFKKLISYLESKVDRELNGDKKTKENPRVEKQESDKKSNDKNHDEFILSSLNKEEKKEDVKSVEKPKNKETDTIERKKVELVKRFKSPFRDFILPSMGQHNSSHLEKVAK